LVALAAAAAIIGAANALNCYFERDLDGFMERTRTRPLPMRRLAPVVAIWTALVLVAVGLPALVVATNPVTAILAMTALGLYAFVYTPMKQVSTLALWVGAVPGAIPPLMGWTAVRGRMEVGGLVLFAVLFFWQLPHFIAIGIFRREDYERAGHKALPSHISDVAAKVHIVVWTAALIASSIAVYVLHVAGVVYLTVAIAVGAWVGIVAVQGFWKPAGDVVWARRLFFTTLWYLTALFLALTATAAGRLP
jgi:protoheme IX farnesyltransferase